MSDNEDVTQAQEATGDCCDDDQEVEAPPVGVPDPGDSDDRPADAPTTVDVDLNL